jgi:hypothetical protein
VTLQLGPSLNPDDIEEGDDCYFECIIKANPPTYKVVWRHNVSNPKKKKKKKKVQSQSHPLFFTGDSFLLSFDTCSTENDIYVSFEKSKSLNFFFFSSIFYAISIRPETRDEIHFLYS